jgi:hypothetical protein
LNKLGKGERKKDQKYTPRFGKLKIAGVRQVDKVVKILGLVKRRRKCAIMNYRA